MWYGASGLKQSLQSVNSSVGWTLVGDRWGCRGTSKPFSCNLFNVSSIVNSWTHSFSRLVSLIVVLCVRFCLGHLSSREFLSWPISPFLSLPDGPQWDIRSIILRCGLLTSIRWIFSFVCLVILFVLYRVCTWPVPVQLDKGFCFLTLPICLTMSCTGYFSFSWSRFSSVPSPFSQYFASGLSFLCSILSYGLGFLESRVPQSKDTILFIPFSFTLTETSVIDTNMDGTTIFENNFIEGLNSMHADSFFCTRGVAKKKRCAMLNFRVCQEILSKLLYQPCALSSLASVLVGKDIQVANKSVSNGSWLGQLLHNVWDDYCMV